MLRHFIRSAHAYRAQLTGAAIVEFALLFPILIAMIMGSYDLGRALTINQKVISASQIIADLITREEEIEEDMLDDIVIAGQMALDPFDRAPMGYDIVGVQYDEDDEPEEIWRVTNNMLENDDVLDQTEGLGLQGEGVVAVTVTYTYEPYFTQFLNDEVTMQEVAILRGRRIAAVDCTDC